MSGHSHREHQAEFLAQSFDTLVINFDAVPDIHYRGGISSHRLWIGGDVREEVFEPTGRDDLQDSAWRVTRIPERMPLVAGLEHEITSFGMDDIIAELCSQTAFQDVAVLIFILVAMERGGQRPGRDRMFDEGEVPARFLGPDHESHTKWSKIDRLPVRWANDSRSL